MEDSCKERRMKFMKIPQQVNFKIKSEDFILNLRK